jgi:hypothetical protein
MSDADQERIARLLREQGQAQAPPDLAGDVMAQVRREPQADGGRSSRSWRPVAAVAAVAAALLAVGFGIATLGNNAGSSSSAGAGTSAAAGGGAIVPEADAQAGSAITVDRSVARQLLGAENLHKGEARAPEYAEGSSAGSGSAPQAPNVVYVSPTQWRALRSQLQRAAERDPHPAHPVVIRPRN